MLLIACSDQSEQDASKTGDLSPSTAAITTETIAADDKQTVTPKYDYQLLYRKIIYSQATLADVRQALTDKDTGSLTNTVHALYSMHWHRGVLHLLDAMWNLDNKSDYPELSWDLIEKPPVRIALASTINRIKNAEQNDNNNEYIEYIRQNKNATHEFILAQVAVAMGFNGDPADVEYLETLASSDNTYVTQTALTGLSLMNNTMAKDALIELAETFKDDPRSDLISELLQQAYNWPDNSNK
jgi:hypothetical protein